MPQSHTHTHTHAHTITQTSTYTHRHTYTHTNKHTHTYTHTHKHISAILIIYLTLKHLYYATPQSHTHNTHTQQINLRYQNESFNGKEFHRKSSNLSFVDKSFNLLKIDIWIPRPNKQVDSYKISASLLMIVILVEEEFGSSMFHGRIVLLRSI